MRDRAKRIWDLPIRLLHWLLAFLILFSWWTVHHHHSDWHIWSGCAVLALLIFRVLWGFVGSSTARFSSFIRGPRAIVDYVRGDWYGIGHNPLGALSVVALLAAVAIQVGLGLIAQDEDGIYMGPLARLVSSDHSDKARELHSGWFNVLLAFIVLHLGSIVIYRLRGRPLTKAMITGRTSLARNEEVMRPAKWWVALVCLLVAVAITRWIIAGAPV